MKEVCHDVQLEPQLIAIEDKEKSLSQHSSIADNARLDVWARGVWALFDLTFIDLTVGLPTQIAYQTETKHSNKSMKNTKQKKKENIMEEFWMWKKENFAALVFLATGGMSPIYKRFLNRLIELYVVKKKTCY